jgi:TolA-binding protein
MALGLLVWLGTSQNSPRSSGPKLVAARGADYSLTATAHTDVVTLRRGDLKLSTDGARGRHLLVKTPDGEVVHLGTTFSVSVRDGRTQRVEVSKGSVVVRLRGQPGREVRAGQSYLPYAPRPVEDHGLVYARRAAAEPAATTSVPGQDSAAGPLRAAPPNSGKHAPRRAAPRETLLPTRPVEGPSAAQDFAAALQSFQTAAHTRTAQLLEQFVANHPHDPKAEDAAYLRVVALLRADNRGDARAAAHTYLARYPHGFRTPEMEQLLVPRTEADREVP